MRLKYNNNQRKKYVFLSEYSSWEIYFLRVTYGSSFCKRIRGDMIKEVTNFLHKNLVVMVMIIIIIIEGSNG